MEILDFIIHFDQWLNDMVSTYPIMIYFFLCLIVFTESSFFPLAPFLPGDGLLFSVGVVLAGGALNIFLIIILLILAGILGNAVAYYAGRKYGNLVFEKFAKINESHLHRTQEFYKKYGSWTFLFSRYVPIVRAIVPLIAGIANMEASKFWKNSIISVSIWVVSLIFLGYQLGNIEFIRKNFGWIVLAVSVISLSSLVIVSFRNYLKRK